MSVFGRILLLSLLVYTPILSHARAQETTSILLFGDSIIAGYGLAEEEAIPAQLQLLLQAEHPDIVVINGGISGDTTSAGRSRLEWTLNKHQPDMVIMALGGNDVLRGIPPDLTKANLIAMLQILQQRNISTVLSIVQAPDNLGEVYRKQFDAIYQDAAKQFDLPLYPFLLSETFGNDALMQPDGIHPNADGAKQIAKSLAKYLLESAFKDKT